MVDRQLRVRVKGSPQYPYISDVDITNTSQWLVSFDVNSGEAKWLPFNFTRILNSSGYDLYFFKNGVERHHVKQNSAYSLVNEEIESFKILAVNSGETISAGDVTVQMKVLPLNKDEETAEKQGYVVQRILRALKLF